MDHPTASFEVEVERAFVDGCLSKTSWETWITFCKVVDAVDGLDAHGIVIELIKAIDRMHRASKISQIMISGIECTSDASTDDFDDG